MPDVVLVLGANNAVNPAAKNDPKSLIASMPFLKAFKTKTIIVNERSMANGYAGLDNELFYLDKSMTVFGDAKKDIEVKPAPAPPQTSAFNRPRGPSSKVRPPTGVARRVAVRQ